MALDLQRLRARVREFLATDQRPLVTVNNLLPPDPFVCALLLGHTRTRGLLSMGGAEYLKPGRTRIELNIQVPMTNVTVIAFCDLQRVGCQFFYGNDLVHGGLGPCPFAFIPECLPGMRVNVVCNALEVPHGA